MSSNDTIPRLIHRVWIDDPMPEEVVEHGRRWQEMHPEWVVTDWVTRDEVTDHFNADLIDAAEVLQPHDHKRFASDLIRLNVLWRLGGVYVDTDAYPLRPMDPLVAQCPDGFLARSPQQIRGVHPYTNAVMGFPPAHPVVRAAIEKAKEFVENTVGRATAQRTGPWLLTDVATSDGRHATFTTLPTPLLYPMSEAEREEAHAVHEWNSAARRRGEGF